MYKVIGRLSTPPNSLLGGISNYRIRDLRYLYNGMSGLIKTSTLIYFLKLYLLVGSPRSQ